MTVFNAIAQNLNGFSMMSEDFRDKREAVLEIIQKECLPSGSGIDSGCRITVKDLATRGRESFEITFGFHFMDEYGYYDGWEDYRLVVRPSLLTLLDLKIVGKNRNDIKDYLYDTFDSALREGLPEYVRDRIADIYRGK